MTMIVPDFWAEGRAESLLKGRQVTVRRFGWSDTNQRDAQRMADERADAALARVLAGEPEPRRDRKVPYNGAQGVPIREEVVSRHGDEVVTRNSYGALCLNTPRRLIADVDLEEARLRSWGWLYLVLVLLVVGGGQAAFARWVPSAVGGAIGLALALVLVTLIHQARRWAQRRQEARAGGRARVAEQRAEAFVAAHPDWGLRVYHTPAGLRLMATHRPFAPGEAAVAEFFDAVQADRQYVAMCRNQHCFRARLTAKPWRIGIPDHLKPRPGVWPVPLERQAQRTAWLAEYDARANGFAACRFERALGNPTVASDLADVVALHDTASRALRTDLPLA